CAAFRAARHRPDSASHARAPPAGSRSPARYRGAAGAPCAPGFPGWTPLDARPRLALCHSTHRGGVGLDGHLKFRVEAKAALVHPAGEPVDGSPAERGEPVLVDQIEQMVVGGVAGPHGYRCEPSLACRTPGRSRPPGPVGQPDSPRAVELT